MSLDRRNAVLFLMMTSFLWSFGGLFIKIIPWSPFVIAGIRSWISAIVFFIYMRGHVKRLNKKLIIGALIYTATLVCYVTATKLTTSANAILLQYTAPIWAAVFGYLFFKERITKLDIFSLTFVGVGIVLFFLSSIDGGMMLGNVIALLSGVAFAGIPMSLKRMPAGSDLSMVFYGNLLTGFFAVPGLMHTTVTLPSVGGILFLGVFQLGISYILYTKAVKHVSAIDAVLIPIIEPLFNPLWVFMATGEHPSILAVYGGVIVLATIVFRSLYLIRHSTVRTQRSVE
ncbi:MAG: hypothetical protein PWP51_2790 [Clostridiales bacterium]|nr:hypothetical protein [Clostridiales bacterium]